MSEFPDCVYCAGRGYTLCGYVSDKTVPCGECGGTGKYTLEGEQI